MSKLRKSVSRSLEMHRKKRRSGNKQGRREMLIRLRKSNKMMQEPRSLHQERLLVKLRTKVLRLTKAKMLQGNSQEMLIKLSKRTL